MDNDDTAPTKRQIFACWFTLCRAISVIGRNVEFDPVQEATRGHQYADEFMNREPR